MIVLTSQEVGMFIPTWLYFFTMLALLGLFLFGIWYAGCKISRLQKEKTTLTSLVYQMQKDSQLRQKAHAMEISRLQAAMDRALQTQGAAHERELAQLRAHQAEVSTNLQKEA